MSLDLNKIGFEEELDILNMHEKSRKSQSITESGRCGKWDVMHINVECLTCCKVEALGYFQLSDMRYNDRNVVMKGYNSPATLLNLNTSTNFRTCYRVYRGGPQDSCNT